MKIVLSATVVALVCQCTDVSAADRLRPVDLRCEHAVNPLRVDEAPAVWLRKEFGAEKRLRRAAAYVSGVGLYEVYLNGKRVKLEVTVVNSWRNRLIGDRELPEDKRLTRTNINVTKNWKREPSGLLGPVSLQTTETP